MSSDSSRRIQVPEELKEVLLQFSISFLVEQPPDVIDYAVEYFTKLQAERPSVSHTDHSTDDQLSVNSQDADAEPPVMASSRRKSVFAEAYDPEADDDDDGATAVFPKTDEQRARLVESVKNVLLFRSLEKEQMNQVLDAMFERKVQPGDYIIRQGDDGDNFYVIESGVYKVFINDKHINTYNHTGLFGELALLYNMPRAATVQAETSGLLWAMDRQTFRRILLKSAFRKRKMYEELLNSVPMLKALQNYERMNLADALVSKSYDSGERIIKQGDAADGMYFIEEGTVSVRMDQDDAEVEISQLGKGQYFGELALVTHRPRAASVYATGGVVKLAFLDVKAFERLLGPCMDIMKRNIDDYESQLVKIFGSKNNITDTR
ncbi:cAMP-dependent protein kinase type II regulatory subunit isoform X1 [Drosophila biarmipes]|uniref:cAMP-dependent protein kinase type II regulatory subunit isoform X1 n=1 Tax=Drosophila biarmipes TaxID=125945 RepID=UPI0007E65AF7|nr:cAMP-dependent protein kinase type II regulatory subunit isoform X1 [Drosophila biarmipes]XP_050743379.1 cAMP-dependent protein kinase type II regulatory subunit isoform X1 [Drosophila biarmipes]XP_050743380.1 cAMP-dependent protein kinase type II regulatory subunit isoform X1 [Drosophila biarmipes]